MRNKNILIVDPFSMGALYVDEFVAEGCNVYCLISNEDLPNFMLSALDTSKYKQVFYTLEEAVQFFRSQVLFVAITGCETGVYFSDKLNGLFNIVANAAASSLVRRDKFLMQMALKNKGLRYIHSWQISDKQQDINEPLTYSAHKWVVKPLNSAGSDGVVIFDAAKDVQDYIDQYNWQSTTAIGEPCRGLILQEFIAGEEYVVDLVKNGDDYFIASVCKYTKVGETGLVYHCLDILDPLDNECDELIKYAIECAEALELVKGPMHMEFIKDAKGYVMIEAGARLHGGVAPSFFKSCYEPHLLGVTVDSFLNRPLKYRGATKKCAGKIVFLHTDLGGIMPNLQAQQLMQLKNLASYQGHKFFTLAGEVVPRTKSLFDCPGIVWLAHEYLSVIDGDEQKIRDMFSLKESLCLT